jgi:hypothetical protein
MYVPFHLLKNLHQESFSIFYFFFTLPPRGKQRWQPRSARAYMRVERWVLPSFYFCQVGLPNCWDQLFLFCQNYMDAKLVCQTIGVALSSLCLGDFATRHRVTCSKSSTEDASCGRAAFCGSRTTFSEDRTSTVPSTDTVWNNGTRFDPDASHPQTWCYWFGVWVEESSVTLRWVGSTDQSRTPTE